MRYKKAFFYYKWCFKFSKNFPFIHILEIDYNKPTDILVSEKGENN